MRLGNPERRWLRRGTISVSLVCTAALAVTSITTPATAKKNDNLPDKMVKKVKVENVLDHLDELQEIADDNDGTRYASSPGYNASIDYVADLMQDAGYRVTIQNFPFVYTEELRESLTQLAPVERELEIDIMQYSGATPEGGITGDIASPAATPKDPTPGCEASDFGATFAGKVALIQRGACSFAIKAQNAEAAGATAAIIYNNATDPDEALSGTLGDPEATGLPTGGVTGQTGEDLLADLANGTVTVNVDLEELREDRTTSNLLAETRGGDPDNVVMAGAHLDSVNAGPGINDNGTGSAGILETALQLAEKQKHLENKVRFAWWGAEEFGLLGSQHYVSNLTEAERDRIALYLNFDMIGSPNGVLSIYDGDDSDAEGEGPGPEGSAQVEDVFERFFDERNLPHIGSDFTGRSDYGPFLEFDIPAGGLFTGADGTKTEEQVDLFGGVADVILDPCYHEACDSMTPIEDGADADLYAELDRQFEMEGNVNVDLLDKMADAVAYTVATFANDTSSLDEPPAPANPDAKTGEGIMDMHGDDHADAS